MSASNIRRTVPVVTVASIADELHELYPDDIPTLLQATKLVQVALQGRGYTNIEPDSAVWSSNREQILEAFRVHYSRTS